MGVRVLGRKALLTVVGLFLAGVCAGQGQDFLNRLPLNQATESEGQIYVRVQDQRRGATQALERILIGRATVLAGYSLCQFQPKANQRLDANLQGVQLIHSHEADGVMTVVIKLKKQKPDCTVQVIAPRPESLLPVVTVASEPMVTHGSAEAQTTPERKLPTAQPSPQPTETGYKVRIYSTEH